jgi:hypothetical protein
MKWHTQKETKKLSQIDRNRERKSVSENYFFFSREASRHKQRRKCEYVDAG